MAGVISLRHLPESSLRLAQHLSQRTGLSVNDVLRQAIISGLLVEVTKFAPEEDGTLGGLEAAALAKALRRHLGSAIDLLLEYGEHPSQHLTSKEPGEYPAVSHGQHASSEGHQQVPGNTVVFEGAMGDDLDALGIGMGFSERAIRQT